MQSFGPLEACCWHFAISQNRMHPEMRPEYFFEGAAVRERVPF
jgi:hypothetical protein